MRRGQPPIVVMTSNRTRELHDALKRRCLYHWIPFPDAARERAIIDAKVPGLAEDAAQALVAAVTGVRALRLIKPPGIAETIEWAQARQAAVRRGRRVAGRAAALARPAAQGAGGHRGRAGPRRGARMLTPSTASWPSRAPIPRSDARGSIPAPRCATTAAATSTRLYWLARVTLVCAGGRCPPSTRCSTTWFAGGPAIAEPPHEGDPRRRAAARRRRGELQPLGTAEGTGNEASAHELRAPARLRPRPAEDLAELRKALRRPHLRRVRSRRRRPARRGPLDLRRTLRGAPARARSSSSRGRDRPQRTRPLLLLIDVSGSLRAHTPDSPALRAAAAQARRSFTFGTRLTRITAQLRERDVDTALASVSARSSDADGGTRIGAALQEFLATPRYADRARGALAIVLSDGLERGDPAAMARPRSTASRGSRTGWSGGSPLACDPTYRPSRGHGRDPRASTTSTDGWLGGARESPARS